MIKIFIGTSAHGEDDIAERTLKYSLEKHCSEPLDIVFMRNKSDGIMGQFDSATWATPFTNLRWAIPSYCNFSGRAIYMDVDMLNLKDISELYNIDLEGKPLATRKDRLCVIVFDCKKMKTLLDPIEKIKLESRYGNIIYKKMLNKSKHFDPRWNCLDGENRIIGDIWNLHFTSMPTQPWKPAWYKGLHKPHPRQDLVALWETYRDEMLQQ